MFPVITRIIGMIAVSFEHPGELPRQMRDVVVTVQTDADLELHAFGGGQVGGEIPLVDGAVHVRAEVDEEAVDSDLFGGFHLISV